MSRFDKALFIQLNQSLQINQNKNDLLDSLDGGNRCILVDNYIRHPGVHDFDMVPNPHLRHPTTGDFRTDIRNCIYLCNYLFFALYKYRSASDRERWYNFGKSPWSGSYYLYIVRSEDANRSGFADIGVLLLLLLLFTTTKGLSVKGFYLLSLNSLGTPLRAHYSSRAFNYRVVLLLRDWYFLPS